MPKSSQPHNHLAVKKDDDEHLSHDESRHSHDEHHGHCHGNDCCDDNPPDTAKELIPPLAQGQRFSWQISGMDCPSCAKKIERAVSDISGVERVVVLFATEKLVVDAQHDVQSEVEQLVMKTGYRLSSTQSKQAKEDNNSFWQNYGFLSLLIALIVLCYLIGLVSPEWGKIGFIVTTLIGVVPVIRQAWRLMRSGSWFSIETLMSVAAIGALLIGATEEAAMVLVLFMIGELLEGYAARRARKGVSALMSLVPEEAVIVEQGVRRTVSVSSLLPGQIIEVAAGARLPADAILQDKTASFDESALTGESIPVERRGGERISAGSLVVDRVCQLQVISEAGNNAIDRILQLIEEADEKRAPIARFLDRFSQYYTPAIMLLALLVVVVPPLLFAQPWDTWIYRGLALLLIGCPCALVISTPAAITSGLAAAARQGALIKGGATLEQLGRIQTVAFDKTGTLTEGRPQVTGVYAWRDVSEEMLICLAAAVEAGSSHPLAQAIMQYAEQQNLRVTPADNRIAKAGIGVEGEVNGQRIRVCAPAKLEASLLSNDAGTQIEQLEYAGNTVVVVLQDSLPLGIIALSDTLRPEALMTVKTLRNMGIQSVMLTGDNPRAAKAIAEKLAIDYRAGLLPEDKVSAVTELGQYRQIAIVGDGINDAPAMKAASVGIAMGSGSDVALETADAALTHNRLNGLVDMIALSRATHANIRQNITIALGLKAIFLVTSLVGVTGLWLAVLADSGATALVTVNALRLLRSRKSTLSEEVPR